MYLPRPIACLSVPYSASWSTYGLATTTWRNRFKLCAVLSCGASFHAAPQKTVNTCTAPSSGPPRYVSWGGGGAAIPADGPNAPSGARRAPGDTGGYRRDPHELGAAERRAHGHVRPARRARRQRLRAHGVGAAHPAPRVRR